MNCYSIVKGAVVSALVSVSALSAQAAPVLDGGWAFDIVNNSNSPSNASPYVFTLLSSAWFRVTDAFIAGDVYTIFDGSMNTVLTTSFQGFATGFGDNTAADGGWTSARFSSGEVLLGAGSYSLSVWGDCAAGCPSGFYARLDSAPTSTVPLPAALPLLGVALVAVGAVGTRRKLRGDA